VISVRSKESTDVSSGVKSYGLAIQIEANSLPAGQNLCGLDEMDSLLGAMDYLIKIKYDVTRLPGFEASYTTKAGLRSFPQHSARRCHPAFTAIWRRPQNLLSSVQMTQLYD